MPEPNTLNQKKTESIRVRCTPSQKTSWVQWIGAGEINRTVRQLLDNEVERREKKARNQ